MRNSKIRKLAITAVLASLMLVLQILGLGIIPIPPAGVTVLHIPIIIGTLACGLAAGLALGLEFGLMSLIMAYRTPTALSVCFMNPLIAIVPRLLIPVAVWLVARAFSGGKQTVRDAVCAATGSLTNTVLVLGLIALLYGPQLSAALGVSQGSLLGATLAFGAVSGLPEAAVAVIITVAVNKALSGRASQGG